MITLFHFRRHYIWILIAQLHLQSNDISLLLTNTLIRLVIIFYTLLGRISVFECIHITWFIVACTILMVVKVFVNLNNYWFCCRFFKPAWTVVNTMNNAFLCSVFHVDIEQYSNNTCSWSIIYVAWNNICFWWMLSACIWQCGYFYIYFMAMFIRFIDYKTSHVFKSVLINIWIKWLYN